MSAGHEVELPDALYVRFFAGLRGDDGAKLVIGDCPAPGELNLQE